MRACPCCMEMLTPGVLGFGGRRLAGHCAACGDAVCQACLGSQVLEASVFRKRADALLQRLRAGKPAPEIVKLG